MPEPPSYFGGSQVRKMLLADLSLHLRFSGGSGIAEGENQEVRVVTNQALVLVKPKSES